MCDNSDCESDCESVLDMEIINGKNDYKTKVLSLTVEKDVLAEFNSLMTIKDNELITRQLKSLIITFQSNITDFSSLKCYINIIMNTLKLLKRLRPYFAYCCKLLSLISYTNGGECPIMTNNIYPILIDITLNNSNEEYQISSLKCLNTIVIFNCKDELLIQSYFDTLLSLLKESKSTNYICEIIRSLVYISCFCNINIPFEKLIKLIINHLSSSSTKLINKCMQSLIHFFQLYFIANNIKSNEIQKLMDDNYDILYRYINKIDSENKNKRNKTVRNNLKNLYKLINGDNKFKKELRTINFNLQLLSYNDIMKYHMLKELIGNNVLLHIKNNPKLSELFSDEIIDRSKYNCENKIYHKILNKKKDQSRYNERNKSRNNKYNNI